MQPKKPKPKYRMTGERQLHTRGKYGTTLWEERAKPVKSRVNIGGRKA